MNAPAPRRTSAYLQRCLDEPLAETVPRTVSQATTQPPSWTGWLGSALLYQYTGLHHISDGGPFLELEEGGLAEQLDDFLCRVFIRKIPDMVRHLQKFERVVTEQMASDEVQAYFEESMHCCTLGFSAAAVALARACLEQALRETIQLPHTSSLDLAALIAAADRSKVLDAAHLQMAREVQQIGNGVLHRQPCTNEQVMEVVVNVRAVVEELYGPAPDD